MCMRNSISDYCKVFYSAVSNGNVGNLMQEKIIKTSVCGNFNVDHSQSDDSSLSLIPNMSKIKSIL